MIGPKSLRMGSIFENALFTIAAAGAKNPHEGCFFYRNPLMWSNYRVAGSRANGLYFGSARVQYMMQGPLRFPSLYKRAWILQERFLSRRILFFDRWGLYWRCSMCEATEQDPDGRSVSSVNSGISSSIGKATTDLGLDHVGPGDKGYKSYELITEVREDRLNLASSQLILHQRWFDIVQEYSMGKLTKPEDKLVALAGIVSRIQLRYSMEYMVGLWKPSLQLDLLWYVSRIVHTDHLPIVRRLGLGLQ
jgi:hypothetical protein